MRRPIRSERGVIAITVLWILAVLGILSIGLGRQAELELSLARSAADKLQGKYAVRGAVSYAMARVAADAAKDKEQKADTLYQCAVFFDGDESPQSVFENIAVGEAKVDIGYWAELSGAGARFYYGLEDERGRININLLNTQTAKILIQLIELLGYDEQAAQTITFSSIDWRDSDSNLSQNEYGAEDDHYMSLSEPYHTKNRPFENVEELLLVRGMTPEIFAKIKNYVTVYPKQGNFAININTAPAVVIQAMMRAVSTFSNTSFSAADRVTEKVLAHRSGKDGIEATADDLPVDQLALQLSQEEQVTFLGSQIFRTTTADLLRVNAEAKTPGSRRKVSASAVIAREGLELMHWRMN